MLTSGQRNYMHRLKRRAGIFANNMEARWFDFKSGTITRGKVAATNLDIETDNVEHLNGYQAVNERHIRAALESIEVPPNSTFLDIGCGKGKALIIAAGYNFVQRAIGIELSRSLCEDAMQNVKTVRSKQRPSAPITVVQLDATKYEFNNNENIVFMNNPFNWPIMSTVIDRMCEVARRNSRDIFFLYGNPANAEAIKADGKLQLHRELKFFGPGRNINIYRRSANSFGWLSFFPDLADLVSSCLFRSSIFLEASSVLAV